MKTKHIIWIASLFIALVIALMVSVFNQAVAAAQNPGMVSMQIQTTPTIIPEGISEIGSTDGILLMGFMIVLIVILPLLAHRKK